MSFSLSNISGSQIQKDSFINNLTVACDPGLLAPKNLNGLPNPLNLEKRDGKSAIAVDICCLDLACLNVTEKLTVNDATFNTLFASFLTADNANIDTLEGRVVNLKASNAVGAPGGAAKLTIGDTAAGDAMGGDTAIEIVGTNQNIDAINLATGGNITMEQQQQINKELTLNYIYYIFQATECEIKELNKLMNNYITPIIFKLKHEFNRVRPYKLDKLIIPTAPEPKHAAYPSGHSTQAYFISALLSQKYPVKKNSNDKMAIRVATNREVAGIHYVSDSKYGKIVAEYLSKNININDFLNC